MEGVNARALTPEALQNACDVALSEVLKACDGDIPDGWEERLPVSKTGSVVAFGDRVASIFPVPTQNRLVKEKL